MFDWTRFIRTADEFFAAYAALPLHLQRVKLFLVHHTVELYLKAVYTKLTGDANKAVRLGHDIKRLLDECKKLDPTFLPGYELRADILALDHINPGTDHPINVLTGEALKHYIAHAELYRIAKGGADLKYLGTPLKSQPSGEYAIAGELHDFYWIKLLRDIRAYLGHPSPGVADVIRISIEHFDLPPEAVRYLERLYMQ